MVDEKTYAQQLDLLRFQADEISAARLQPEEEAQVEQDRARRRFDAAFSRLERPSSLRLMSRLEGAK